MTSPSLARIDSAIESSPNSARTPFVVGESRVEDAAMPEFDERLEPLVSVVIPTRNRAQLLRRALDSVSRQTYLRLEIIVVVDGEDAETSATIEGFCDSRIRAIVNRVSQGGAEARNIGVRAALGSYIAFLDDDDEFLPNKIELQLKRALRSQGRFPLGLCRIVARSPKGEFIWPLFPPRPDQPLSEYMFCRKGFAQGEGLVQTDMLFVPRELLLQIPFSGGLPRHQEWDWILRAAHHPDVEIAFCDEPLAVWYIEENRKCVSGTNGWESSCAWLDSVEKFVTPRAYAAFLLTVASGIAAKEGNGRAFCALIGKAASRHIPALRYWLIHIGIWAIPVELRRLARKFTRGGV